MTIFLDFGTKIKLFFGDFSNIVSVVSYCGLFNNKFLRMICVTSNVFHGGCKMFHLERKSTLEVQTGKNCLDKKNVQIFGKTEFSRQNNDHDTGLKLL